MRSCGNVIERRVCTTKASTVVLRIRRASHVIQPLQRHGTIQVVNKELVLVVILAHLLGICIQVITVVEVVVVFSYCRKNRCWPR